MELVLRDIGELTTNQPGGDDLLGRVSNAAVAIRDGRVAWLGAESDLPSKWHGLPSLDMEGRAVLPGFVDPHTHLVFAGDRADEFALRLSGANYADILAKGGGILRTMTATRAATQDQLVSSALTRVDRMLAAGTTTVEIKSGYGLDTPTERRMLEAAAAVAANRPIDVVTTFLGAHALPPEFLNDRAGYLHLMVEEAIPACAPLAQYCDVFCDPNAFSPQEARLVLEAGLRFGLRPRLHAEQLGAGGGAKLAAELGAISADHLDYASAEDAQALAEAGTVAVILPGTRFTMGGPPPPVHILLEAGVTLALGTDCNPGTSYLESMQMVITLAVLDLGLSLEQAVWSATRGGALALELPDKGRIRPGAVADLVVLDAPSVVHLAYRPGANLTWMVLKDGVRVVG